MNKIVSAAYRELLKEIRVQQLFLSVFILSWLCLQYILPATVHINNQERLTHGEGPIALILAPTRELAQQIQSVARDFGSSTYVRNTCVFGGAPKGPQVRPLFHITSILVSSQVI